MRGDAFKSHAKTPKDKTKNSNKKSKKEGKKEE